MADETAVRQAQTDFQKHLDAFDAADQAATDSASAAQVADAKALTDVQTRDQARTDLRAAGDALVKAINDFFGPSPGPSPAAAGAASPQASAAHKK